MWRDNSLKWSEHMKILSQFNGPVPIYNWVSEIMSG